ncbi:MAG: hypothetical protein Q8P10_02170 [bacterium]|nr:hypothetical protein [bacterium]
MSKYFYTHLIETESIVIELDKMALTKKEKSHLMELLDLNTHHTMLDLVLSELSKDNKNQFLKHLSDENHDKIWMLLNSKIANIESKIQKAWEDLINQFHKDIKEAKEKKE